MHYYPLLFISCFSYVASIPSKAQDHHHDWTGAIHILNNNSSIDFWDEKKIALAIMNDKDIVVYDNSDFDNFLGYNRSKRSPRQFWTDDRIREAQTSLPKPSRDYFSRLGVETTSDVRLFSTFGAEPARILQADLNRAPWKHYGKLLFKSREGMGACTAAYVHERVLLTAAHCVKQPAYWYSNFIFFHRYNTNSNKGRPIKVKQVFAPKAYDRFNGPGYGDLRFDYAFITTEQPSDAGHLGQKFGHLHDSISSAGYPTNAYRGEKLVYTEGRKGLEETGFVNVPSNAMAEGCSGGAWLIKESGGHFAVGVNSHSRPGVPGMFSPKLNSMTVTLFNTAVSKVGGDRVENNGDHTDTEQSDDDEHEQNEGRHPPHVEPINPSTNHNQKCNVRACERKCGLNFQWQCINGREVCRCL